MTRPWRVATDEFQELLQELLAESSEISAKLDRPFFLGAFWAEKIWKVGGGNHIYFEVGYIYIYMYL